MPESPLGPPSQRDPGAGRKDASGDSELRQEISRSLLYRQVFLATMAPQLLSSNQLRALIHHKQRALLLQQQHLKEFHKQQQIELHQQESCKKGSEQLILQQLLDLQQQQQLRQVERAPPSLPSNTSSASVGSAEFQQIWKELQFGISEDQSAVDSAQKPPSPRHAEQGTKLSFMSRSSCCSVFHAAAFPSISAARGDAAAVHVLFGRGTCNWPGCEAVSANFSQFLTHVNSEHTLDDRSTAQCRVQMQIVQQLELQLFKERQRLQAMMAHLHLPLNTEPPKSEAPVETGNLQLQATPTNEPACARPSDSSQVSHKPPDTSVSPPQTKEGSWLACKHAGTARRHFQPSGFSLSTENEYELYKNAAIRPPFTYATLIRQAILEASDKQLTLNEIYNWFTRTFVYFRHNAATWKNAVRHNLSLHRCFVRVENVKGAVWTVDEEEYQRRRSQRITGTALLRKNLRSSLGNNLQSTCQAASLSGPKEAIHPETAKMATDSKVSSLKMSSNLYLMKKS